MRILFVILFCLLLGPLSANACSIPEAVEGKQICNDGERFSDLLCICVADKITEVPETLPDEIPNEKICEGRTSENTRCFAGYYFDTTTCKCARYHYH